MKDDKNLLPEKPAYEVDFPIDRVEAEHVSRREFSKFLCLISGGLAAGTGWVAVKDHLFPPFRIKGEVRVCNMSEVAIGATHQFRVPGTSMPYILIRPSGNEWFAYEQKCTHLSCAVYYSPEHGQIQCPCHNGWFDARTGAVLQGPPPRPLPHLRVITRGDEIFVAEPDENQGELADNSQPSRRI